MREKIRNLVIKAITDSNILTEIVDELCIIQANNERIKMANCFEAGVKFARDMFNNPSNTEYLNEIYNNKNELAPKRKTT